MALMLGSLYEALKDAGSAEDKARSAAEEVAGYEERMRGIERRLVRVEALQAATFAGVLALLVNAYFW